MLFLQSSAQLCPGTIKTEMPNCWWDAECLGGTSHPWTMRVKLIGPGWSQLQAHYSSLTNTLQYKHCSSDSLRIEEVMLFIRPTNVSEKSG